MFRSVYRRYHLLWVDIVECNGSVAVGFCVVINCFTYSFSDIELFALFVSCLCHDLDHRGTNNQYQVASVSNTVFGTVHNHTDVF